MKKIIVITLKIFLLTFIGNILLKFIIPALGIENPIIKALLTPLLTGVLIYFFFFKKSNTKKTD